MTEIIDAEIIDEPGTDIAVREAAAPTLFGTDDPGQIIQKAQAVASVLNDVITKQKLYTTISGKRYVLVEGWTTLGALCNVFAKTEWTHPIEDGWEAAVIVVNGQGVEIGRAEAQCLRSERNWKNRDDFALKSMAQTRAMGKALRMPLGWIAVMGGYQATPAEEMPAEVAADDVPFDETGPAQGLQAQAHGIHAADTGGAGDYASESDVTTVLEIASSIDDATYEKAVAGIARHRSSHEGQVDAKWLGKQADVLMAKASKVTA